MALISLALCVAFIVLAIIIKEESLILVVVPAFCLLLYCVYLISNYKKLSNTENISQQQVQFYNEKRDEVKSNIGCINIAFVFACPGKKEQEVKTVLAGSTGDNLNCLLTILNSKSSSLFPSICRYAYFLINASEKVYYKDYCNSKRTLPSYKDIIEPENIKRLKKEFENKKYVICFGKTANKAIKMVQDDGTHLNVIKSKYHLGFQGINHIRIDVYGEKICKKDSDATKKRLEVVANEIIEEINKTTLND